MDKIYEILLKQINLYIIVKDKNNNIIYINKPNDLYKLNNNNKLEIKYDDKIYKVEYIKTEEYNIEIYSNITEYKLELEKLKTDYLTKLYNRHAIFEKIKQYNLEKKKYTIVMGDIDHFKNVNDRYGHLVGDYVLKNIGAILLKNIDEMGIVGRYGGEEFIIVIFSDNIDKVFNLIENIRKEIEETTVIVNYNDCIKEFKLSMTFGICQKENDETIEELISKADIELYKGKVNGRNQTNIYKKNDN